MNKFYNQRLKIGKRLEDILVRFFKKLDFQVISTGEIKQSFESSFPSKVWKSDLVKNNNPIVMLRWLPDFLLVSTSNNEFKDAFFIDIKAMYTPIYLKTFPEQLKKEYGKQISIEDIGNIEREAYKSYTSHQKSGSKVAVLVACTYNPKLLLCDYIENLEIIYKDERERNKMSSGSTTPRVNIDLSKMSSFEDFLSPLMGDNFDRDLYQILFDFIEKEFNFIGYPRVVSKDRAEEVKEYLTKKVGRELLLKNI